MDTWETRVSEALERPERAPEMVVFGLALEAAYVLDLLCTYAHPGTPWLEELVDEAVRQIRSLEDRDVGAYAFARRHLLPLMRELDRCRDPVALPHFLVCHDPVALMRNNPERRP